MGLLFLVPIHSEPPELFGGAANTLHDNSYLAFLRIAIRDGDGDALAVLMDAQDDELARLVFPGNVGRFNAEQIDIRGDEFC